MSMPAYLGFFRASASRSFFSFFFFLLLLPVSLAYSSVEKHKEAVDCFKRALELEPENEGYKSNLAVAQEKLETQGSRGPMPQGFPAGLGGLGGGPGGLDINNLLGNPTLMNMATSMLSDPNMQAMMGQMMSGGGMGGEGGPAGGGQNMEGLLQA